MTDTTLIDTLEAAQARIAELEAENTKYAEHLMCLGVPKFGPASGPSGLNDDGFRLIGSDAAVQHFKQIYNQKYLQGLDDAAKLARTRYEAWKDPCPVECDVTACEEIACAIEALKKGGE